MDVTSTQEINFPNFQYREMKDTLFDNYCHTQSKTVVIGLILEEI